MSPWLLGLLIIDILSLLAAGVHYMQKRGGRLDSPREWSREDLLASVLGALAYVGGLAGMALLFMNMLMGYVITAITVLQIIAMYKVIDPKLRRVSGAFEQKQAEYLEELDRIVQWEREDITTSPAENNGPR